MYCIKNNDFLFSDLNYRGINMSYLDKLTCKNSKCSGQTIVPIKLIQKGSGIVMVGRCPNCHNSMKLLLPLGSAKDQWLSIIGEKFFCCDVCGADNQNNWEYAGSGVNMWHPYWYWNNMQERLKIKFKCPNCGKKRAKVITADLWSDISKTVEQQPEKPAAALKCPHCDASITPDAKVCPSCKKEIACNKCGNPIAPGGKFCSTCGDRVEELGVPAMGPEAMQSAFSGSVHFVVD